MLAARHEAEPALHGPPGSTFIICSRSPLTRRGCGGMLAAKNILKAADHMASSLPREAIHLLPSSVSTAPILDPLTEADPTRSPHFEEPDRHF